MRKRSIFAGINKKDKMKKILFILTVAVTILSSTVVNAQEKIGFVRSSELLTAMPQFKAIETEINQKSDLAQAQIKSLEMEYTTMVQKYQADEAIMTDIVRESRIQGIQDLKMRVEAYYEKSQQDILNDRNAKLKPLLKLVNDAITAVAKENGYAYILDYDAAGQTGVLVYADDSKSVMGLVKAKLGLQ